MQPIVRNAITLLDDALNYLTRLTDAQYAAPVDILSGAAIGQHTRHVLEFYQCLLQQLQPGDRPPARIVNYDARKRDRRIEQSAEYAAMIAESLQEQLGAWMPDADPLWVVHCDPVTDSESLIASSPERELLYNIEHTIHHFALIRIGLRAVAPHIELPEHFGVAPATMRFRQQLAVAPAEK